MKRANTTTKLNHSHLEAVRRARMTYDDTQGLISTRYMDRAVTQAVAQIQRPSRIATENVRQTLTQRFLEAIK
jgi:hypothetical protein